MVLEVWSTRREGQCAKAASEDCLQWSSTYQGVRDGTLSLLGKGQHPKSSMFLGPPSRIGDEEWGALLERHGSLPFCGRELPDR